MALNPEAEGAGATGTVMLVAALVLVAIGTYIVSYRVHQPVTTVVVQGTSQTASNRGIVQAAPTPPQNPTPAPPISTNTSKVVVPPAGGGDTSSAVDMKPS